jgi:hypothetical protein
MSPASTARCSSAAKTPFGPMASKGLSVTLSPVVVMGTTPNCASTFSDAAAALSAVIAMSVCLSASALPRVPTRRLLGAEIEDLLKSF